MRFYISNYMNIYLEVKSMIDYPLAVFIDTNVIEGAKFDFGSNGTLAQLRSYCKDKKIDLYISDIAKREIENHLREKSNQVYNKINNAQKEVINDIRINSSIFEGGPLEDALRVIKRDEKIQIGELVLGKFREYLDETKATILESYGICAGLIIDAYFDSIPPFSTGKGKKNEFPDAIMIEKLKNTFDKENPVYIVTNDHGFKNAFKKNSGFIIVDSLKDIYAVLSKQEEAYEQIMLFMSKETTQKEISDYYVELIEEHDVFVDGRDIDSNGIENGHEYDETYIENISNFIIDEIYVNIDEIYVNKIGSEGYELSIECNVKIDINCYFDDYSGAIYDKEEGKYWFVRTQGVYEEHKPSFEITFLINPLEIDKGFKKAVMVSKMDVVLDEFSRINREYIDNETSEDDFYAEQMDVLEDRHRH